jgi:RNA polymerase sigma-70 factor, ECF subfamily
MPEEKLSDHALIDQIRGGDEGAFGELMSRYRGPITNYLYRFLNDYEEAVDLAQETFVRVYFALDRYHTGFAFSTYIYRIATNLAISEIRRRKRRRLLSLTGLFSGDGESEVEFQPPDKGKLADEALVAGRPPRYRRTLVRRDR